MDQALREKVINDFKLCSEDIEILDWYIKRGIEKLRGTTFNKFKVLEPSASEDLYEALRRYRNWLEYRMIANFAKLKGKDRKDFFKLNELAEYEMDEEYDDLLEVISDNVHYALEIQDSLGRIKIVK